MSVYEHTDAASLLCQLRREQYGQSKSAHSPASYDQHNLWQNQYDPQTSNKYIKNVYKMFSCCSHTVCTLKSSTSLTIEISSGVTIGLKLLIGVEPEPIFWYLNRRILKNRQRGIPAEWDGGTMISNAKLIFASGSKKIDQLIDRTCYQLISLNSTRWNKTLNNSSLYISFKNID